MISSNPCQCFCCPNSIANGLGNCLSSKGTNRIYISRNLTGCKGKNCIAVKECMGGFYSLRKPIVGHLSNFIDLLLSQSRVCSNHTNDRIFATCTRRGLFSHACHRLHHIENARKRLAVRWLAQQGGDPYVFSVTDLDGRVAIDYGVYGAPETFVIDKAGMIRHKHIGPLDDKAVADKLLPLIRKLEQQ